MLTLPNKIYDAVKYLVLIAIPALATAYLGLADALNLPNADTVVKVLAVLATLLGTLVGISARSYNNDESNFDGVLEINKHDPSLVHSLNLDNIEPAALGKSKTIRLKVTKNPAVPPDPEDVAA